MEEKIKDDQLMLKIKQWSYYFFLYAFLGWCLETAYCMLTLGIFHKRGFLYGPICPIYGFGAILLLLSLNRIKGNKITKFIIAMITFSLFEFIVSYILEMLFHQRWWDYSNEFLNIEGRISLLFSIAWGIIGILFVEKIHPFMKRQSEKIMKHVPLKIQNIGYILILFIFIIDIITSIIRYIK